MKADIDAVVVGAGFAGLYLLHRLRQQGFSARGFESGGDVGGTWYWNRYPGCRCDIESIQYSYQFSEELQQEWTWSERYASQPELLAYIEHVADRFDLRRDITFETRVASATFDDDTHLWTIITTDRQGLETTVRSRFFLLGSGVLSTTTTPKFPQMETFQGDMFHTGRWPHEPVDFTGKRVGVIGTGSSGIQSIPVIAEQAEHLYVFQRTPNYVVPAMNRPRTHEEDAELKADYAGFRARQRERPSAFVFPVNVESALSVTDDERFAQFERQWQVGGLPFLGAFGDMLTNAESNQLVTEYWQQKVTEVVDDPATAELLIPKGDIFGGKRLCAGTNYLETYNRSDVTLVDVSADGGDGTGIEYFTPQGMRAGGHEYELDVIVFATGFDAMTGSVVAIDITGPNGSTIKQQWSNGADTYLGMAVHGFPNLFNTQGPGGPGVFVTMVTGIEHQSDWIVDCLSFMREHGYTRFDATADAQNNWVKVVDDAAAQSLRPQSDSWYTGANIAGKHRKFMPYIGGFIAYREHCQQSADNEYAGFEFASLERQGS